MCPGGEKGADRYNIWVLPSGCGHCLESKCQYLSSRLLKHFDYRRLVAFISLNRSYVVSPFVQDCRAAGWSGISDSSGELMANDIVGRRI